MMRQTARVGVLVGLLVAFGLMVVVLDYRAPRAPCRLTDDADAMGRPRPDQPEVRRPDLRPAPSDETDGDEEAVTKAVPREPDEEGEPVEWQCPRFSEGREERHHMVLTQIEARDVEDETVLDAMHEVPRHLFVPGRQRPRAHIDYPLPIGYGQTISQPFIVAHMTEILELEPGDRALEIGTGSGYQAAVLSEITPYVYTIEIVEELAEQAGERLETLGYRTIQTKQGDGYFGWEEHGPFDAIIVTAASGHVPPPLMRQLKPGGRMVIPVRGVYDAERLVLVLKDQEGNVRTRNLMAVRFVPLTGHAIGDEDSGV
jgi:protein-L-isoaspartate(D-aspartate) O-methyltransferase